MVEQIRVSQIRRDLIDYENEFLNKLMDKKHAELIEDFAPFEEFDGNGLPKTRIDGTKFKQFLTSYRLGKLGEIKDEAEKFLINCIKLGTIRKFTRSRLECLHEDSKKPDLSLNELELLEKKVLYWRTIGYTIVEAIKASPQSTYFRETI